MKKIVSSFDTIACDTSLFVCDADHSASGTAIADMTAGSTAATSEDDLILTATDEQLAKWRALTDKRIAEIENTPNMDIPDGATVYYVSNNGDDDNDGLTPETAWASLSMVNSGRVKDGCYVLFERGGLWRGPITLHDGVTYSAYGEGDKPRLYASLLNGADPELWTETEVPNVWKIKVGSDCDVRDIGFVICDGQLGAKAIIWQNADGTPVDFVSGYPFASYADLKNDLQFLYSVEGERNTGYVYMFSEGNPGDRFDDIEFGVTVNIMYAETLHDVTVDNIAFSYTGAHGFGIGFSTNITVRNCTFRWIGGGLQPGDEFTAGHTRYGNAVEIYGGCDGYYVDNNYMCQIYDTGITCQYRINNDPCYMFDQKLTNNVIEYCDMPFEHFNNIRSADENSPKYKCTIDGLLVENNITWHTGEGLCRQRPYRDCKNFQVGRNTRMTNFVIKDNLMIGSDSRIFGLVPPLESIDGSPDLPVLIGNTFVHDRSLPFGRMTHDRLTEQAYDSTIPDALPDGSSGNKFYALPDSGEPTKAVEPSYEIVKFGRYEQDGSTENGTEDIEWYVLDRDGDYALLFSRYVLDAVPFRQAVHNTWELSPIREMLNGTFTETAFTADELAKIRTTHVVMDENPDYPSDSGNDTDDRLFHLSYTEMLKYFPDEGTRICKATKYAHEVKGVVVLSSNSAAEYSLRTIGIKQDLPIIVQAYGNISTRGDLYLSSGTIRPAMWVKIDK